jgi:hypothetical protein
MREAASSVTLGGSSCGLLRPWIRESLQVKPLFSTCCAHLFHTAAISLAR